MIRVSNLDTGYFSVPKDFFETPHTIVKKQDNPVFTRRLVTLPTNRNCTHENYPLNICSECTDIKSNRLFTYLL